MTTLDLPTENSPYKKSLLLIDLYVQLIIIAVTLMLFLVDGFAGFWGFYVVLGGYQLLSSIIHLFVPKVSGMRKAYYPQLVIHLILIGVGILGDNLAILYIELFATPLTALYYLSTTIVDLVQLKKK